MLEHLLGPRRVKCLQITIDLDESGLELLARLDEDRFVYFIHQYVHEGVETAIQFNRQDVLIDKETDQLHIQVPMNRVAYGRVLH